MGGPADIRLTVDRFLGSRICAVVVAHHRRRLRRIGWDGALDPPAGGWAAGDPPPRDGCSLEVLIDGEEALPRMAAELAQARSHIYLTGWQFSPDFPLVRDEQPRSILRNLLAELAERVDVRVLAWAGAPLPLFRPSRGQVAAMRDGSRRASDPMRPRREGAAAALPSREDDRDRRPHRVRRRHRPHDRDGDRFDCSAHVARRRSAGTT